MFDRSGQQIDNYRLLKLIGQGNFGEVYLGEHIYRKTRVAIKILKARLEEEELQAFINEARIFRLRHPNIVAVLDFGLEGATKSPFIVMDYAQGGTLRQRHPGGTRVSLGSIVRYIQQVAPALQYAHDDNLVHRDVKPENMLLDAEGNVLVSDFGVAITTQSVRTLLPSAQNAAGTPYYMAPEQFLGKPGRASDQYALGITVYEWLCGRYPFNGSLYELFGQHQQVPPPPLPRTIPLLTSEVERVVLKALAKDPKERFSSVMEFASALENGYNTMRASIEARTKEQWFQEGFRSYEAQHYEEAISAYSCAIELDPGDANAYYNRANTYFAIQDYRAALADYDNALKFNTRDASIYYNRGNTLYLLNQYEQAVQNYTRALEIKPDHTQARTNLTIVARKLPARQPAEDRSPDNPSVEKGEAGNNP
jgi:serine/threonine protein kinase